MLVTVDANNLQEHGFFCYKSKPKTEGYKNKKSWIEQRFAEGMKLQMIYDGKRSIAFVEYLPSEFAWRTVNAENYLVIHCIWVVGGSNKGQGYGSQLIHACLNDAEAQGKNGIIMVSSSGVWLSDKGLFLKQGFEEVGQAAPSFSLLVKKLNSDTPTPSFPQNWAERLARYPQGMTILYSDQCPYIPDATQQVIEEATQRGIPTQKIYLETAQQARELAPSPYGVFNIIYEGQLFSYHYLLPKDFDKHMSKLVQNT